MKVRDALAAAVPRLADASETPRLDAELLMAHALGTTREMLLLHYLGEDAPASFDALVTRRLAHEPVAYITGTRDFWTISVAVGPGVLVPRPDSETLIEAALAHFAGGPGPRSVLDLGTGSGALLLAALDQWPDAHGIGVDNSNEALRIAGANVCRLGLGDRTHIVRGRWDGANGPHDLILCNPPYVAVGESLPREVADWEPASALFAGPDGLDDYRKIAPLLGSQLAPKGIACIEIGSSQARAVTAIFNAKGLDVSVVRDLSGRDRCLTLIG